MDGKIPAKELVCFRKNVSACLHILVYHFFVFAQGMEYFLAYAVLQLDQFGLVFCLAGHKTHLKPGPRGLEFSLRTCSCGANSQTIAAQTNKTFWL